MSVLLTNLYRNISTSLERLAPFADLTRFLSHSPIIATSSKIISLFNYATAYDYDLMLIGSVSTMYLGFGIVKYIHQFGYNELNNRIAINNNNNNNIFQFCFEDGFVFSIVFLISIISWMITSRKQAHKFQKEFRSMIIIKQQANLIEISTPNELDIQTSNCRRIVEKSIGLIIPLIILMLSIIFINLGYLVRQNWILTLLLLLDITVILLLSRFFVHICGKIYKNIDLFFVNLTFEAIIIIFYGVVSSTAYFISQNTDESILNMQIPITIYGIKAYDLWINLFIIIISLLTAKRFSSLLIKMNNLTSKILAFGADNSIIIQHQESQNQSSELDENFVILMNSLSIPDEINIESGSNELRPSSIFSPRVLGILLKTLNYGTTINAIMIIIFSSSVVVEKIFENPRKSSEIEIFNLMLLKNFEPETKIIILIICTFFYIFTMTFFLKMASFNMPLVFQQSKNLMSTRIFILYFFIFFWLFFPLYQIIGWIFGVLTALILGGGIMIGILLAMIFIVSFIFIIILQYTRRSRLGQLLNRICNLIINEHGMMIAAVFWINFILDMTKIFLIIDMNLLYIPYLSIFISYLSFIYCPIPVTMMMWIYLMKDRLNLS